MGTTQIGKLPAAKTGSLLSFAQYSTSPFKNAPYALKCPARFTVVKGDKRILEISIVENPPPIPPKSVDLSAIDNELANLRGSLNISSHPGAFTKVTLRQCMDFFENDEDEAEAEDIRCSARHNPSGPIYYASYRQFDFRSSLEWYSELCARVANDDIIAHAPEERPPILFLAIGTTTSTKSDLRDYAKRAFLTPLDPKW